MNDIELGAELENLTLSGGWKHLKEWMQARTEHIGNTLKTKKFESLSEVQELQAELRAYRMLEAEISDGIRRANEARKKRETE